MFEADQTYEPALAALICALYKKKNNKFLKMA